MRPTLRPGLRCAGALALAALTALPVGAVAPAHAGEGEPAYSGYATESSATPVHLEFYEPTIPIPANPQAELSFGYSMVEADSSTSLGRASYLWPGDAVGEGWKTIIENLGFPPQVSGPLAGDGYPFQVNAGSTGRSSARDEPFPGMVMRARSSDDRTIAETGYSTDCQVEDGQQEEDKGDGDDAPALPSLPGVPPPSPAPEVTATSGGQQASATRAEDDASCRIPAELAALVDFGGYISTSAFTDAGSAVTASSRTALTDVELLGGVITVSDVHAGAVALSDGQRGTPRGRSGYGTLAIAGQEFTVGPDGVTAGGRTQKIPGLPDEPADALKALGVTITAPRPSARQHGDQATTDVSALVVTIDSAKLRHKLDVIPFADLVDEVPDEAGELKKLLGAAVYLAPRFVITLGSAQSGVDTVQGIEIPALPTTTGDATQPGGSSTGSGGATTSGGGSPPVASAPSAASGSGTAPAADGNLQAEPAAAGLPPVYSLPGLLLLGGIALASVAGGYLRRIGVLALGGAGSCPHGLDRGLPDLRKVRS
jgi:hypothetical protein